MKEIPLPLAVAAVVVALLVVGVVIWRYQSAGSTSVPVNPSSAAVDQYRSHGMAPPPGVR
jgi:hypothetical protein